MSIYLRAVRKITYFSGRSRPRPKLRRELERRNRAGGWKSHGTFQGHDSAGHRAAITASARRPGAKEANAFHTRYRDARYCGYDVSMLQKR